MKCTPEYHAETKRLQKDAADARAVLKAMDSGDFGPVIRAKAKEFTKADTAADEVVSKVHEYVNQYAEHTKGEVADAISGYGHEPKPRTLTEDQQRLKEIQQELRETSKAQHDIENPPQKTDKASIRRVENQIEELQRQIDYGESKKESKKTPDSPELAARKEKLKEKQQELENLRPAPGAHLPKDPNETFNQREKTRIENRMQDLRDRIARQDGSEKATPNVKPSAETLRLRDELKALEKEHEKLKPSPAPTGPKENPKEKARRTALTKELQEVKDRIASGNYDKPPRVAPEWSRTVKNLMADVEGEKIELEKLKHSLALKNRTWPAKVKDATLAYSRAMILLGYHVIGKLAAYSAIEAATLPLRALTSEVLRRAPGLRDTFDKAPIAGGGFNGKAIGKAYKTLVDAETRKAMRDRLLKGYSDEDAIYGKKKDFQTPHPLLEMSGRLHEMIKTPLERAGFQYANEMYLAADLREMKRQDPSLTPEEMMDRATSTEATLAREAKSYAVGKEWVLKGDSELVNGWRAVLRSFKGKENDVRYALTNGIASFFEYMEPIIKVPANLVSETANYTPLGFVKAGSSGIAHAIRNSKELRALSQDEAEYIANSLVKGTVGSLAMAAYWYGRHAMTGYEQDGDYKKYPNREADTATIGGVHVGKWAFHHPLTSIGQLVATVGRVYDEKHSVGEGLRAGAKGLLDQLPFVNTIEYNGDSLKDIPHFSKFLAKQASNFVPQFVKEAAKDTDPAKRRTARKGHEGEDTLKSNFPVLREQLPRG